MIEWQFYWPSWYKIIPWWNVYPADEFGPKEIWFGIGPLQVRKFLYYKNN